MGIFLTSHNQGNSNQLIPLRLCRCLLGIQTCVCKQAVEYHDVQMTGEQVLTMPNVADQKHNWTHLDSIWTQLDSFSPKNHDISQSSPVSAVVQAATAAACWSVQALNLAGADGTPHLSKMTEIVVFTKSVHVTHLPQATSLMYPASALLLLSLLLCPTLTPVSSILIPPLTLPWPFPTPVSLFL
jgi:hypothetical protein